MGIFHRKRSKHERELRALLGDDAEIPSLQRSTLEILRLLRDPDVGSQELAKSLQWDPGLVVRVLRTVNSAAFGTAARIEDVGHAIAFLGRSQLEQLVLAIAVRDQLPSAPAPGFQAQRFWRAAAFRAGLARGLAQILQPARSAEAFTAGLLQDLAVPVLAHAQPERYGPVLEAWHADGAASLADLEHEAFGWDHGHVGALLGRTWHLSETLVHAIELHHGADPTDWDVPAAVRLAALHHESRPAESEDVLIERARSDYGLSPDETRDLLAECKRQADELAAMLSR